MPLLRRVILLAVSVAPLLVSPVAPAQEPRDVAVRLTGFSAWSAPGRPLSISLSVTNGGSAPVEDVSVRLFIRDRVRSRSALQVALDRLPGGEILAGTTEDLGRPVAVGETVPMTVTRDLGSLATAFRQGAARNGVYPLTIRVQAGARTVAERSGAFVFLAAPPQTRLNVIWVVPLHRQSAADSLGTYNKPQLTRDLQAGGTVRRMLEILERHKAVPLTIAPSGAFAHQLLDVSDGFDSAAGRGTRVANPATDPVATAAAEVLTRLKAAIASPVWEIASGTYARADIPALVASDMALDAGKQIREGRRTVADLLGREPNPGVFADGVYRVDTRSAQTFAALGTRTLVLDPAVVSDRELGRFGNPDRPEQVRVSASTFGALVVDQPTRQRLESQTEDPMVTAMGVLAETAISYFELPGLAAARTIVLATSSMPSPDVAGPLLDALAVAPWARMRTVSDTVADPALQPGDEALRLVAARPERGDRLVQARAARRAVDLLTRVVTTAADGAGELERLDRLVLIAESADYARRQSLGSGYARAARGSAEQTLGLITVPSRRVTLTARGGRVPVTIVNDTPYTIRLNVRLDSPKVAFPRGAVRQVTIEGKRQTLTFDLEARTAGSFPVSVVLETNGGDVIGTGQLLVRSTAVSAVTLMATAGGALFLVGAWARRALRRPKTPESG